ncbi:MAG TPA: cation diffusion facilitator family transporter [Ktedonobacterales bacterium]|nr:cation diffusion facilitator family transporter [Ktedonobacterales bacterium]
MSIPTHLSRGTRGQHGMRRVLRSQRRSERSGGEHTGHLHTHNLTREKLRLGFFLTLLILAVECTGGLLAHSLALFSDAGHVLTDAGALGLAWFAAAQAERPANARRTYGYHRVGILTALANGVTLVVIAVVISFEAYRRFTHPNAVQPGIMIVSALIAIGVNLYIGLGLHGEGEANINARAASLHVFGDVGASIGVILGAIAIAVTGASWVDPLVSVVIALLVVGGALRLIVEAVNVLLEATPRDVSLAALVRDMLRVPGVRDIHDLHVWTISSGMHALSCHAVIDDLPPSGSAPILDGISAMLRDTYHITHTTVQFESSAHGSHEGFCACPPGASDNIYCDLRTQCGAEANGEYTN